MAQFMPPSDHFEKLVQTLDEDELQVYRTLINTRPEPSFQNRPFVIYQMVDRKPEVMDHVRVLDFLCNEEAGASCEMYSDRLKENLVVGYIPIQLFDYPIFVHLPLHGKLRWSTTPDQPLGGSLAFDILIRTKSRLGLRERGVVYCETGVKFATEFQGLVR